ncbi:S1 RNA-binding domain-containing protein [Actinocrispum wychmicini]|uniref:S1 RNA-binding domain-containing protein n=1 Tax=Actinocrispum wychmicini TaxID=1213861 RepID=UPI001045AD06
MVTGAEVWVEAKESYPVGAIVEADVTLRVVFGIFVELDRFPSVSAIVDIASYRPDGAIFTPEELPPVGTRIRARVVEHNERTQQIKLRVGP